LSVSPVNQEVRRKDKAFSFSSTIIEALTARRIGSNHRKGKGDIGKSNIVNHQFERTNVLARKKVIERLIV